MAWNQVYSIGSADLTAVGHDLSDVEAEIIAPDVQALLADTTGVDEVRKSLESVTRTDFSRQRLEEVLFTEGTVEEWRVGEALAEHHLTSEHNCLFPWPSGRDLKNPGTSSGGVDLIGFEITVGEAAFALGEVKTSQQQKNPPDLMSGRHGMKGQLEGLRDVDDRQRWAIKYIALHAVEKDWFPLFQQSMIRYLADPTDIRLYGTLIHITQPDARDLKARATSLAVGRPAKMKISLAAIYATSQGMEILANGQIVWETAK